MARKINVIDNNNNHIDTPLTQQETVNIANATAFPLIRQKLDSFSTIRQGNSTNALTKLRAVEGKNVKIDNVTGTGTVTKGNFTLSISNYAQLTGLKTSTHQLLDAITVAYTETGSKSPTVVIPLTEYMDRRGLKDRKEAKNQVKADLEILRQASITGEEKQGKHTNAYSFVNIADSGEIRKNGDIVFTFGHTFHNMLLGYPVMPYPAQLQTINNRRNPNSYYLLRRITEHKNMNVGKANEDIISIKTLLAAAPYLPTYEDVMATDRAVNRKIIEPFERDMDILQETLSWHYCHSNGAELTEEELEHMNYDSFSKLLVKTEWKSYPDQTERLKRKAERIEANKDKPKKKRGRPPKKKPAEE